MTFLAALGAIVAVIVFALGVKRLADILDQSKTQKKEDL